MDTLLHELLRCKETLVHSDWLQSADRTLLGWSLRHRSVTEWIAGI